MIAPNWEELRTSDLYGCSKDVNGAARQFAVGVVQSAEGIPLAHEVFAGNLYEAAILEGMMQRLLSRFPTLARITLVADRGPLNLDNLTVLETLQTSAGTAQEYILAVPARLYVATASTAIWCAGRLNVRWPAGTA